MNAVRRFIFPLIIAATALAPCVLQADDPLPTPEHQEKLAAIRTFMLHDRTWSSGGQFVLSFADVDGDGRSEIIRRTTAGLVVQNLYGSRSNNAFMQVDPALNRSRIIGLGDFDGDGYADVVAQDNSGRILVSLQQGIRLKGIVLLANGRKATPGWHASWVSDFNWDGKPDIYWGNVDGRLAVWLMDGTRLVESRLLASRPLQRPSPSIKVIYPYFQSAMVGLRTIPTRTLRLPPVQGTNPGSSSGPILVPPRTIPTPIPFPVGSSTTTVGSSMSRAVFSSEGLLKISLEDSMFSNHVVTITNILGPVQGPVEDQ